MSLLRLYAIRHTLLSPMGYDSRVSRAPVSYLQLFVNGGAGDGLPWKKGCRGRNLFK